MIVDLLRNDLGKICKYGSINVNKLYNINSKTWHLLTGDKNKIYNFNLKVADDYNFFIEEPNYNTNLLLSNSF